MTDVGVRQVDSSDRLDGNFLEGVAPIEKTYTNAKKAKCTPGDAGEMQCPTGTAKFGEPWTAYFTGGNRITRTTDIYYLEPNGFLRNNDQGRFRLEVTVNLHFPMVGGVVRPNASPIAALSRPVVPVPYTGRGESSAYGMLATFQVAAYDPDVKANAYTNSQGFSNEFVFFFLGSPRKYGLLLSNQVRRKTGRFH